MISSEPSFSKFLKEVMTDSVNLTDPTTLKLSELGEMVEKALNAVLQLSSSMVTLENRIERLEGGKSTKGAALGTLPTPEYSKSAMPLPPPPPPTGAKPPTAPGSGGTRSAIMSELKDIFVKKGVYREYK